MVSRAPFSNLSIKNLPIARSATLHMALLGSICALGVIFFWPSIHKVAHGVIHRQGSSHGIFIPFLATYFIYLKWGQIKKLPVCFFWPAFIALPVFWLAPSVAPASFELQFMAFAVFMAAAVLATLGIQISRTIVFPILFTITMIPIPEDLYVRIADMTRHVALNSSLAVLTALHIPFYNQGWTVKLPNAVLEVAISCSGIRYLISYFVFGMAYAYLFRATALGRILIVAATIPISLFASSLRLTIIFLATYFISPRMAEHWPHVILSWCVFFTILFTLLGIDQYRLKKNIGPKTAER